MDRTTTPDPATSPPDPYAIALLRGGDRAAVTVAVLALHLRGAVDAGRPGTVRRTGPRAAGAVRHPLEKAVRTGLYRPAGPRELPGRAVVRRALAGMRDELVAARLLRTLPPGRTRAARRILADLREHRPMPAERAGPHGLVEEEVLLTVALHGGRALTALLPRFARDSGLTGPGALADEGLFPFGRGGGVRAVAFHGDDTGRAADGGGSGGGAHGGHHHGGFHGGHDFGGGCGGGGFD
ncbi:TIGR04222 domain-containing membrane protein [Streptomyces sp. NPDC059168]|uniref:TIGR04222 domain-containing membrane protein n=1 Tax=Streptomyces sp. NPDC059168 TaxID=3346753 RepID=UPI0036A35C9A